MSYYMSLYELAVISFFTGSPAPPHHDVNQLGDCLGLGRVTRRRGPLAASDLDGRTAAWPGGDGRD